MSLTEAQSLLELEQNVNQARDQWRQAVTKVQEATVQQDALYAIYSEASKALNAHPEQVKRNHEEAQKHLRRVLGVYLFKELVEKRHLSSIEVAKWRVETRHRNTYNECQSITVVVNGKTYKYESGEWGSEGHEFNAMPDEPRIPNWERDESKKRKLQALIDEGTWKREGKSVAWAWEECLELNPDNDVGAILALIDLALEYQGIGSFLDSVASDMDSVASDVDSDSDDDEQRREASFTGHLLTGLHQLLGLPLPDFDDSGDDDVEEEEESKEPPLKKQKTTREEGEGVVSH